MAVVKLSPGIEELRGKLAKRSGFQMRIKEYKDDSGRVIKYGPQEYFDRRSRNYKRSPRTAAEQAQASIWKEVCGDASAIYRHPEHPRYAELRARWNAQFKGSGDPYLNEGRRESVIYGMFPVFVRMVLLKERKENCQNGSTADKNEP